MPNQATVISWVHDLVPELNSSKSPESVLLKFAKSKNLPVAQLEKLAQVYNTAKTLSFQDTSSDRAGMYKLVDVPSLIGNYSTPNLKLAEATVKAASEPALELDSMPNMMAAADEIAKAASSLESHIDEMHAKSLKVASQLRSISTIRREMDMVDQEIFETELKLRNSLEKVAYILKTNPDICFTKVHQDIIYMEPDAHDTMCKVAEALNTYHHMNVVPAQNAGEVRYVKPQSDELHSTLEAMYSNTGYVKAANILMDEYTKLNALSHFAANINVNDDGVEKFAASMLGQFGIPTLSASNQTPQPSLTQQGQESISSTSTVPSAVTRSTTSRDDSKSKPQTLNFPNPADVFNTPAAEALNLLMPGSANNAIGKLVGDPRKDTKRIEVEDTIRKVRMDAVLQGLLMNDPQLSDLTEEEEQNVINVFNTVARAAPFVAADPTVIRPILRNVNEYGGLTPQDFQLVMDMETKLRSLNQDPNMVTVQKPR